MPLSFGYEVNNLLLDRPKFLHKEVLWLVKDSFHVSSPEYMCKNNNSVLTIYRNQSNVKKIKNKKKNKERKKQNLYVVTESQLSQYEKNPEHGIPENKMVRGEDLKQLISILQAIFRFQVLLEEREGTLVHSPANIETRLQDI